jgi:2-methylisocitrate lyase-like PEP mutase family enzyme
MLAALAQPVFLRVITFLSKNNGQREAVARALLDEPRLQVIPGCGDGMGARLIEEAGFRAGFISGSSISAMRLAMPDMDLVSFGEMAAAVETSIAAAPNVLWLADGDTGHGNARAVQKVIRTYARRGAAAVLIEDKIWPRPLGHDGAKLVVESDAAILRCRAAVEACRDEGILLLARTDARVSRSFDEALARIQAFVAEGAHILFLDSRNRKPRCAPASPHATAGRRSRSPSPPASTSCPATRSWSASASESSSTRRTSSPRAYRRYVLRLAADG